VVALAIARVAVVVSNEKAKKPGSIPKIPTPDGHKTLRSRMGHSWYAPTPSRYNREVCADADRHDDSSDDR